MARFAIAFLTLVFICVPKDTFAARGGMGYAARNEFRMDQPYAGQVTIHGTLGCRMGSVENGSCVPEIRPNDGSMPLVLQGAAKRAIELLKNPNNQTVVNARAVGKVREQTFIAETIDPVAHE